MEALEVEKKIREIDAALGKLRLEFAESVRGQEQLRVHPQKLEMVAAERKFSEEEKRSLYLSPEQTEKLWAEADQKQSNLMDRIMALEAEKERLEALLRKQSADYLPNMETMEEVEKKALGLCVEKYFEIHQPKSRYIKLKASRQIAGEIVDNLIKEFRRFPEKFDRKKTIDRLRHATAREVKQRLDAKKPTKILIKEKLKK